MPALPNDDFGAKDRTMIVLGLDTALKACSAAILKDGAPLARTSAPLERGHAERLAPMVAGTLAAAGLSARDIDRVGVVVGPGTFAGVRVGLAFARGLAVGTGIEAVGVTSLAALAAGIATATAPLRAAVIDARRGQVYAALYDAALVPRLEPFVAAPEEALRRLMDAAGGAAVALAGDGVAPMGPAPKGWIAEGGPDVIDAMAVARLAAGAARPEAPPAPLYLRPPDARPAAAAAFAGLLARGDAP
ncbi:tRNA (adenosine(37)-N6)-threonylcarbamoyltransferase complex dimerization subunit type 1 TsaB [Amphiplicatus metriothermophilus]|uniref:tRNA threonylcarbamoyladenosine biosynthesis protein TsaB n=1 Tax=Amphiplicatus metriothermophilus TaxID=1519374 RepID=A0A239PLA2_9PROT|nr:tRNA (adenosine(37)-N6)-threonylcarbamoyltransferase complex dimerization subunit type 1 TsaB [Amphiplicatus metriothermophilus]MBB5517556.1 tRNA threonylcarbamoyladenosine biosynthesis protein TsaB [Amphiplicatus metriothermophilus]SNT68109.1 tRNA threonylcarbamoyladenosine biosynthesis protein TsaB [Amphiplicatus metriothermophilus]